MSYFNCVGSKAATFAHGALLIGVALVACTTGVVIDDTTVSTVPVELGSKSTVILKPVAACMSHRKAFVLGPELRSYLAS